MVKSITSMMYDYNSYFQAKVAGIPPKYLILKNHSLETFRFSDLSCIDIKIKFGTTVLMILYKSLHEFPNEFLGNGMQAVKICMVIYGGCSVFS